MTRRRKIQILSLGAAAIAVLGGTTASGYALAGKYRADLEYTYRRALSDLGDCVSNMETMLQKAEYAGTARQINGISAKLMEESSGAKASLAALPLSSAELGNISRFIAQVGDYSLALATRVNSGETITDADYETLASMREYAGMFREELDSVQERFEDGSLSIGQTELFLDNLEHESVPVFGDNFEEAANDFKDYPTLIYDGPFSDHIGQATPKFLEGEPELLQGNAENSAAKFWGVSHDEITHVNDTEGNLPTYNFMLGDARLSVTKAGGYIASLINPRQIGAETLDYEAALAKAQEFFSRRGITDLQASYYVINDGKCTINFAAVQDGVLLYPDLVKAAVALDNGEIVEYNSSGYLMNHTQRDVTPVISEGQARGSVSPRLTAEPGKLCVIPTSGKNEVLCYEFLCTAENGQHVLVYVNAANGSEEQILLLMESDQGILTR